MPASELAIALSTGRSDRVNNIGFSHGNSLISVI
jgi:hypothetical protein